MSKKASLSAAKASYRRYVRNQRGSIAITFGLFLVPILGVAGAAVDYANATSLRSRMAQASDAAALAAVKASPNISKAERDRVAKMENWTYFWRLGNV